MKLFAKLFLLMLVTFLASCRYEDEAKLYQNQSDVTLVNNSATFNTTNLFVNLKSISETSIIFGHHHSTAYGIGWRGDKNRSDVKDVTGSNPGLIGWDFGDFSNIGDKKYTKLVALIREAHEEGIVNTFSWHYNNPVTGKSFYDTTIAIRHILPGGKFHSSYLKELDRIAAFTKHLVGADGKVIPIIFRPFHEMDGSWFWWGKNFCTADEFKMLWQFTVEYLRDFRNVKNLLFAFSPDRNFNNEAEYLERFPGDAFVDILGMDNYYDFTPDGEGLEAIKRKLILLSKIAKRKSKIAAFTETGLEKIPDPKWWTDKLLYVIEDDSINISYVMVWRNGREDHFYAPYIGHISVPDFIKFKNNSSIIFADELPNLFKYRSAE